MTNHAMFLREGCNLPDRLDLRQETFCEEWKLVEDALAPALDTKIRGAGWHFMWVQGSNSRRGFGRTQEAAIHRALTHGLKSVTGQFNAAELDSMKVAKYPGFYVAKATLQPRQIQHQASLESSGEILS